MVTVDEDACRSGCFPWPTGCTWGIRQGRGCLTWRGLLLPHAQSIYQVPIDASASVYNMRRPPAEAFPPPVSR